MIKLLKDISKSITDANYNEFSCDLTVLSITCSVVFWRYYWYYLFCYNSGRNR